MSTKKHRNNHEILPLGQSPTKNLLRWGIDHPTIHGSIPKINLEKWVLTVNGEVENALKLDWKTFSQLPRIERTTDFHCVEGWSVLNCRWEGVNFKTIIDLVKPKASAKFVSFECADGYTTSLSIEELLDDDALLAYKLNGEMLEEGFGKPLRLVVPNKYGYKSAMWIIRIKFTSKKELGYWEQRGYSDTANVWENDRYSK